MMMKKKPKAAKNWIVIDSEPVPKARSVNSRGSSIGSATRSSQKTKAISASTPPPSSSRVVALNQPWPGASITP